VATPVTMPQLGETVVEGTITKWLKKEGETVERDEPLFEISTDKVDTEVPSPMAGKVVEIKVPEGETVSVGTELAMIEPSGDGQAASDGQAVPEAPAEAPAETAGKKEEAAAAPEAEAEAAPISGEAPQAEGEGVEPEAKQPEPAATPAPSADAAPPPTGQADGQAGTPQVQAPTASGPRSQILSPLVRRLAEENGIDLSRIQGTGTGGRITKKDVQTYLASGPAQPAPAAGQPAAAPAQPAAAPARQVAPPPAAVGGTEEVVPLSRMRQAIAKNMVASIQSTARAWNLIEVNMENVARTREAARESFKQREGIPLTYMPFVARAVCEALLAFPEVNSELREDQLIRKHFVNLGIAVALEDGLIVPVVKGADTMNIVGLARAIQDIATRARSRKLNPDDVHGGTFTITNPGPFGSIISVPIINPPQCAILAFDAVEKRPVVVDDAIAIRHMVYLSMSWDHRIIDGATAARFLARLRQNLETWDFGPEVGLPARQP
jgi:pyruvate dehydrogenase E2 component (dihydrolipoamide acetyltransferase)